MIATLPLLAWHGPGWWIVFVPFFWIGAFVVIATLFFRGRRGWGCGQRGWGEGGDPARVLERRYANGELSAEEFRERARVLRDVRGCEAAV